MRDLIDELKREVIRIERPDCYEDVVDYVFEKFTERMQSRLESLEKDAALFRRLAYYMRFTQDGEYVTMNFICPLDATKTHDMHKDFMEPGFTESVRRTVESAMKG